MPVFKLNNDIFNIPDTDTVAIQDITTDGGIQIERFKLDSDIFDVPVSDTRARMDIIRDGAEYIEPKMPKLQTPAQPAQQQSSSQPKPQPQPYTLADPKQTYSPDTFQDTNLITGVSYESDIGKVDLTQEGAKFENQGIVSPAKIFHQGREIDLPKLVEVANQQNVEPQQLFSELINDELTVIKPTGQAEYAPVEKEQIISKLKQEEEEPEPVKQERDKNLRVLNNLRQLNEIYSVVKPGGEYSANVPEAVRQQNVESARYLINELKKDNVPIREGDTATIQNLINQYSEAGSKKENMLKSIYSGLNKFKEKYPEELSEEYRVTAEDIQKYKPKSFEEQYMYDPMMVTSLPESDEEKQKRQQITRQFERKGYANRILDDVKQYYENGGEKFIWGDFKFNPELQTEVKRIYKINNPFKGMTITDRFGREFIIKDINDKEIQYIKSYKGEKKARPNVYTVKNDPDVLYATFNPKYIDDPTGRTDSLLFFSNQDIKKYYKDAPEKANKLIEAKKDRIKAIQKLQKVSKERNWIENLGESFYRGSKGMIFDIAIAGSMLNDDMGMVRQTMRDRDTYYRDIIYSPIETENQVTKTLNSIAEMAPGLGGGILLNIATGGIGGTGMWMYQGTGAAYSAALDAGIEDSNWLRSASIGTGILYGLTENYLAKLVKGNFISQATKETVKKTALSQGIKFVTNMGKRVVEESAEEWVQEGLIGLNREINKAISNEVDNNNLTVEMGKVLQDANTAFTESIRPMFGLAVLGVPFKALSYRRKLSEFRAVPVELLEVRKKISKNIVEGLDKKDKLTADEQAAREHYNNEIEMIDKVIAEKQSPAVRKILEDHRAGQFEDKNLPDGKYIKAEQLQGNDTIELGGYKFKITNVDKKNNRYSILPYEEAENLEKLKEAPTPVEVPGDNVNKALKNDNPAYLFLPIDDDQDRGEEGPGQPPTDPAAPPQAPTGKRTGLPQAELSKQLQQRKAAGETIAEDDEQLLDLKELQGRADQGKGGPSRRAFTGPESQQPRPQTQTEQEIINSVDDPSGEFKTRFGTIKSQFLTSKENSYRAIKNLENKLTELYNDKHIDNPNKIEQLIEEWADEKDRLKTGNKYQSPPKIEPEYKTDIDLNKYSMRKINTADEKGNPIKIDTKVLDDEHLLDINKMQESQTGKPSIKLASDLGYLKGFNEYYNRQVADGAIEHALNKGKKQFGDYFGSPSGDEMWAIKPTKANIISFIKKAINFIQDLNKFDYEAINENIGLTGLGIITSKSFYEAEPLAKKLKKGEIGIDKSIFKEYPELKKQINKFLSSQNLTVEESSDIFKIKAGSDLSDLGYAKLAITKRGGSPNADNDRSGLQKTSGDNGTTQKGLRKRTSETAGGEIRSRDELQSGYQIQPKRRKDKLRTKPPHRPRNLLIIGENSTDGTFAVYNPNSKNTVNLTYEEIRNNYLLIPEYAPSEITKQFPTNAIKVYPDLMQFKSDVNEQGVTEKLKDVTQWDPFKAGNVTVWIAGKDRKVTIKTADGEKTITIKKGDVIVADGHHRLELANRLGVNTVNAIVLRESDGISIADARRIAAENNIAQGNASIYDAAKYFRENKYTVDDLKKKGIALSEGLANNAYNIAQMSEPLFGAFLNDDLLLYQAAAIGEVLGGYDNAQLEILGMIKSGKYKPRQKTFKPFLKLTLQQYLNNKDVSQGAAENVDLFGNIEDNALKTNEYKAKVISKVAESLKELKALFNAIANVENKSQEKRAKQALRTKKFDIDALAKDANKSAKEIAIEYAMAIDELEKNWLYNKTIISALDNIVRNKLKQNNNIDSWKVEDSEIGKIEAIVTDPKNSLLSQSLEGRKKKKPGPSYQVDQETGETGETISQQEAVEIIKKLAGDDDNLRVELVKLIQTPDGQRAFGSYLNALIKIAENPDRSTPYHEYAHYFWDYFLTKKQQQQLVNFVRKNYPKRQNQSDKQIEEFIVSGFYEYFRFIRGKIPKNPPKSLLFRYWNKIIRAIQRFVKVFKRDKDLIKQFYDDILSGKKSLRKQTKAYQQGRNKQTLIRYMAKNLNIPYKQLEKEFNETRQKYINTAQWLKAPNGQDSNLAREHGENLWVMVRTPRFKQWFGDWQTFENIKNSKNKFSKQIDDFLNNKISKDKVINVSNVTPNVLQDLEIKNRPIVITQKIIKKIINEHSLTKDLIKQIPEQLYDPIAIFESATRKDSFVIMTELIDKDKKTVIVTIHIDGYINRINVNSLSSAYGKDYDNFFTKQINKGNLKYLNKKKADKWFTTRGLQLPKMETIYQPSDLIIAKDSLNVKKNVSKVVDENGEPLVMYHGGAKNIKEFDVKKAGSVQRSDWGKGIYFTPSKAGASYYAEESGNSDKRIDELYEKYKKIAKSYGTSPMYEGLDLGFGTEKYKELDSKRKEIHNQIDQIKKENIGDVYPVFLNINNPLIYQYVGITDPYLSEQAIARNKDGVIIINEPIKGSLADYIDEVLVFKSNQIKSIDNVGTFSKQTGDIRYMFAGEKAIENLPEAEKKIAKANIEARNNAYNKLADKDGNLSHKDNMKIKNATGWYKDKDGKWKFEIDDSKMEFRYENELDTLLNLSKMIESNRPYFNLSEIILHKKLFKYYPKLKNYKVIFENTTKSSFVITFINDKSGNPQKTGLLRIGTASKNINEIKKNLLHEIQHAVQDIEGFARGGSIEEFALPLSNKEKLKNYIKAMRQNLKDNLQPKIKNNIEMSIKIAENILDGKYSIKEIKKFDLYLRLLGEMEARETSYREDLTEAERRKLRPYQLVKEYEGIDVSEAIIQFEKGNIQQAVEILQEGIFINIDTEEVIKNIPAEPKPGKQIKLTTLKNLYELFKNKLLNKTINTPIGLKYKVKDRDFLKLIAGTEGIFKGQVKNTSTYKESINKIESGQSNFNDVIGFKYNRGKNLLLIKDILENPHLILFSNKNGNILFLKNYQNEAYNGVFYNLKNQNIGLASFSKRNINKTFLERNKILWMNKKTANGLNLKPSALKNSAFKGSNLLEMLSNLSKKVSKKERTVNTKSQKGSITIDLITGKPIIDAVKAISKKVPFARTETGLNHINNIIQDGIDNVQENPAQSLRQIIYGLNQRGINKFPEIWKKIKYLVPESIRNNIKKFGETAYKIFKWMNDGVGLTVKWETPFKPTKEYLKKRDALEKKLMAGEITRDEFNKKVEELEDELIISETKREDKTKKPQGAGTQVEKIVKDRLKEDKPVVSSKEMIKNWIDTLIYKPTRAMMSVLNPSRISKDSRYLTNFIRSLMGNIHKLTARLQYENVDSIRLFNRLEQKQIVEFLDLFEKGIFVEDKTGELKDRDIIKEVLQRQGFKENDIDALIKAAVLLHTTFAEGYEILKKYKSDVGYIRNYFPHIWADPEMAEMVFASTFRSLPRNTKHAEKRFIRYLKDGIEKGLVLKHNNPVFAMMQYMTDVYKIKNTIDLMHKLTSYGYIKFIERDLLKKYGYPKGYTRIFNKYNHLFKIVAPAIINLDNEEKTVDIDVGEYVARTDIVDGLRNWIDSSIWRDRPETFFGEFSLNLYKQWIRLKNTTTQMKLALSLFHVITTGESLLSTHLRVFGAKIAAGDPTAIAQPLLALGDLGKAMFSGAIGITKGFLPARFEKSHKLLEKLDFGNQLRNKIISGDFKTDREKAIAQMIIDSGARFHLTIEDKNKGIEGLRVAIEKWKSPLYNKLQKLGQTPRFFFSLLDTVMDPLANAIFNYYVPSLKVEAAWAEMSYYYDHIMKKHQAGEIKDKNLEQVLQDTAVQVWDSIDNRFGEVVYDNLFLNKYARAMGVGYFLSLGWNLGSIREYVGGGIDLITRGRKDVKTGSGFKVYVRSGYLFSEMAIHLMASGLISMIMGGKEPDELEFKDFIFPVIARDKNNNPKRGTFPAQSFEPVKLGIRLWREGWGAIPTWLGHKGAPVIHLITNLIRNEDYYGNPILDKELSLFTGENLKNISAFMVKAIAPISVQSSYELIQKGKREKKDVTDSLIKSFFGVNPGPAYLNLSGIEYDIHYYYYKSKGDKERTMFSVNKYLWQRKLKDYIKNNPKQSVYSLWYNPDVKKILDEGKKQKFFSEENKKYLKRIYKREQKKIKGEFDWFKYAFKKLSPRIQEYLVGKMSKEDRKRFEVNE